MAVYHTRRFPRIPWEVSAYIIETFCNNPDVNTESVAKELGVSVGTVSAHQNYRFYIRPSETTEILVRQSKIND